MTTTTQPDIQAAPGRGHLGMLLGLPILVLLVGGGWVIWRATADLDDIELRALAWSQVATLTWQHIVITVVSAFFVMLIAIR
ncbi:osmoprotectant transport system permease protein [Kineosphaera limosa]|uniref:Uncharacterized protein n=1 Tax=Kineosphaera limosa NBRC 100340 TaxID=1184609 RepID=K6WSU1_9MICO|nr:osmoprotectant transport system permease protein [Kineosphaera limosa]GAB96886.1 hypothetical protein KILIM_051_00290 [Kineosphaera limosa NBRC 100340]